MQVNPAELLDQSLRLQYHDICANPQKQDTLRRFYNQKQEYQLSKTLVQVSCKSGEHQRLDNNIVNNYIQYVYHKYQLEDPIEKELKSAKKHDRRLSEIKTPKPEISISYKKSQRQSTTRSKLERLRQSYKHDCSDILFSTIFPGKGGDTMQQQSTLIQSGGSKQIGYRTKQKIRFKNQVNQKEYADNNAHKRSYLVDRGFHSSFTNKFNSPKETPQRIIEVDNSLLQSQIPVVFRYCPMCQQVVLQHNIKHHEVACQQIKKAYLMPLADLQQIFHEKVNKMMAELREQMQIDEKQKLQEYRSLNRSVAQWLFKSDQASFDVVKEDYKRLALNQYYLITKLNWFKRLREKIIQNIKNNGVV